jgi:hypothetical protein
MRVLPAFLLLLSLPVAPAAAQEWNDPGARALIERGIAARQRTQPDSTLTSYRTRAHGFVFFLAQAGQGLVQPPRLIKADELDVEVYWQAPATSKQVILGWRDGRWLPTDINYHRDHLGIVTNDFGDRIRIGEGDEVRDVVHPLAPDGPDSYDYRLADSVRVVGRDGVLWLQEVEVRPRDRRLPLVAGTLSLDAATGTLVRFRFSFTPAAYLDNSLEDISIVLENARLDDRWWLPWRQEIEIRRRVTWLDFPLRSIIRGRWEIGEYELNVALPAAVLRGPAIAGLRAPRDSGQAWAAPLADAVAEVARPVEAQDVDAVRAEAARIVGAGALTGLRPGRLGVPAVSDLIRVNRVQGLTLGAGAAFDLGRGATLRPRAAFGTSDARPTGELHLDAVGGGVSLGVAAGRRVRDIADRPLLSGVANSLLAQEAGRDQGDYVLQDQVGGALTARLSGIAAATWGVAYERTRSLSVEASPASGRYRPNPAIGVGSLWVARLALRIERASLDRRSDLDLELTAEGGAGSRDYGRTAIRFSGLAPLGPGGVRLRLEAGTATVELPAHRSFAIGGWGTLPGTPFRAWGGRHLALASLEFRLPVGVPAIPLGPFASTGRTMTLAPFIVAGWAGGAVRGVPWRPSGRIRPVAGLAAEWFHELLRVDAGLSLETGRLGLMVDVGRVWWEVL